MNAGHNATNRGYTVARTLRALEALEERPRTAPELAAILGVHARTARRLLRVLAQERWAEGTPGASFRLTRRIMEVAERSMRGP